MKYRVDLLRTQCLAWREVVADNKEKAIEKALPTFHKYDIDDYDEIEVIELDDDEEE